MKSGHSSLAESKFGRGEIEKGEHSKKTPTLKRIFKMERKGKKKTRRERDLKGWLLMRSLGDKCQHAADRKQQLGKSEGISFDIHSRKQEKTRRLNGGGGRTRT